MENRLPFALLGLDTDNGFEFINHNLFNWCLARSITFTRGRPYKKNDQAHVEERNGSIVRKLVGYDRLEGRLAWQKLTTLYSEARLYTNFFQPSMKLVMKKRTGAKIYRKYDQARTPYQRVLEAQQVSEESKEALRNQYLQLNPVALLKRIRELQAQLDKLSIQALFPRRKKQALVARKASLREPSPIRFADDNIKTPRQAVLSLLPGTTFQPIDLLRFGNRGAVDQALHCLVKQGLIARVGWGAYRIPHQEDNLVPLPGTNSNEAIFSPRYDF
jgi:hypothetical protein